MSYFFVLFIMIYLPKIRNKFPYPFVFHTLLFYSPLYLIPLYYIFFNESIQIINEFMFDEIVVILSCIIAVMILLLINSKEYFSDIKSIKNKNKMAVGSVCLHLLVFFLAIISEELYFRWYLINQLASLGLVGCIATSSLLFAFTHFLNAWSNQMFSAKSYVSIFFLGTILSFLFFVTRNIYMCIFLHCMYNSSGLISIYKRATAKPVEVTFDDF